jgi:peptidoglycan-N-acetylglucosamine deacetylase
VRKFQQPWHELPTDFGRYIVTNRTVPILITWDVDPSPRMTVEDKKRSLVIATDLCNEFNIKSTFFVTAEAQQATANSLDRIQRYGHEIGCHGLTHGDEENYDRMPEDIQRDYIKQATQKLQTITGSPVHSFRSPRVKTSARTLSLLSEYGYLADSSVCSQRLDFVSSNLINVGWIFAPRKPYHPHEQSAFRKGDIPVWEVPISALGVPFISAALNILGLRFMKGYFRLLYREAQFSGKPIVYLAHPAEFTAFRQKTFTFKEFTPAYIRTHGWLIRNLLYHMNKEAWLEATREFFAYMSGFQGVMFMTCREYTQSLNQPSNFHPVHRPVRDEL